MYEIHELRRRAALCRRVANQPTQGGTLIDRLLHNLAERLEGEAAMREEALAALGEIGGV